MTAFNPPNSTAVVDVPDSVSDRYVAAGWTRVETERKPMVEAESVPDEKPRPVKRSPRKRSE